ncbi:MAG TPA: hypothetical protein PK718_08715 [Candidatus Methanofastidiosa archaeon]|nr:hypothetical protein [Candidatus Methanofastidiosa archaeon]
MKQQTSVAKIVNEIIDSLPLMGDYLLNNIVNYNGLARWIQPEVERRLGKDVSIESISVAIQRYHFKEMVGESELLDEAISKTRLVLKNDIAIVAYLKNYDLMKTIESVNELVRWEQGETFFMVQSSQELSVVLERDRLQDFRRLTSSFRPINMMEDVTIIDCKYPENIVDIPGYLYTLLRAITLEKLNIIDIFSTFTEFVFLFEKKDAIKAYGTLERLINNARGRESG